MRTLLIDIETRPNLVWAWQTWNTTINKELMVDPAVMICFGYKWLGDKKTHFHSLFHDGKEGMIQAAHKLLDEADVVVHYNGKKFDIPHLNREFLLAGLTPPAPYKQVDLYHCVRSQYNFTYNSLDFVAQQLGIGKKVKHEGFELWLGCIRNDPDSWRKMKRYNVQDVKLLEPLYELLRPWVKQIPNQGAFLNRDDVCPACGSDDLNKRGIVYTTTCGYQRYRCNSCGKWSRSTRRFAHTEITSIAG